MLNMCAARVILLAPEHSASIKSLTNACTAHHHDTDRRSPLHSGPARAGLQRLVGNPDSDVALASWVP